MLKKLLVFLWIVSLPVQGSDEYKGEYENQDYEYSCGELINQTNKFKKMRNGGIVLLSSGVLLTSLGVGMVISADGVMHYTVSNAGSSGDPVGGFGALIMFGGAAMTIAGTVLTTIGGKKYRNYKQESEERKCSLKPINNGLALEIKF